MLLRSRLAIRAKTPSAYDVYLMQGRGLHTCISLAWDCALGMGRSALHQGKQMVFWSTGAPSLPRLPGAGRAAGGGYDTVR